VRPPRLERVDHQAAHRPDDAIVVGGGHDGLLAAGLPAEQIAFLRHLDRSLLPPEFVPAIERTAGLGRMRAARILRSMADAIQADDRHGLVGPRGWSRSQGNKRLAEPGRPSTRSGTRFSLRHRQEPRRRAAPA